MIVAVDILPQRPFTNKPQILKILYRMGQTAIAMRLNPSQLVFLNDPAKVLKNNLIRLPSILPHKVAKQYPRLPRSRPKKHDTRAANQLSIVHA